MIFHYRLIIQYNGTRYLGWQIQPKDAGKTIQGELNRALITVSKSNNIRSMGAGRTDAGVHALGQVAKVSIELKILPQNLIKALNVNLPDDIRVISAEDSDENFLPTIHATSKEYHYRFTFGRSPNAFQTELIANYPFDLDLEKMNEACKVFIGKHDFTNFYCEGTDVATNIREIYDCEVFAVDSTDLMLPSHYVLRIVGSGFLKQMVRLIMGAVWNIGRGKISIEDLKSALGPERVQKLGAVAPPEGLYMVRVNYSA